METKNKAHEIDSEIAGLMYDLAGNGDDVDSIDSEADRLYNDVGTLRDLIGDRIFWACNHLVTDKDKERAKSVCLDLLKISHPAQKKAVERFMIDWKLEK